MRPLPDEATARLADLVGRRRQIVAMIVAERQRSKRFPERRLQKSITRLLDMGVPDYLLASTVTGVLAQRLVRRLCPACSVPARADPALVEKLGGSVRSLDGLRARRGCPQCRQTGFQGRTTVSELLVMDAAVRQPLLDSGTEAAIEAAAVAGGMNTMFQDGLAKALQGETTIEEVLRVTRMS